jgi:hypothetical protein
MRNSRPPSPEHGRLQAQGGWTSLNGGAIVDIVWVPFFKWARSSGQTMSKVAPLGKRAGKRLFNGGAWHPDIMLSSTSWRRAWHPLGKRARIQPFNGRAGRALGITLTLLLGISSSFGMRVTASRGNGFAFAVHLPMRKAPPGKSPAVFPLGDSVGTRVLSRRKR